MYCPRCGIENLNEASFCRACGADISLVPQALTGHLPVSVADNEKAAGAKPARKKKEEKAPTLEKAFENIFVGVSFLLWFIIGAVFFTGFLPFWFWAIFPGFACLGIGVGQYMRLKQERSANILPRLRDVSPPPLHKPPARVGSSYEETALPARDTSEMMRDLAPSSVTEGTTRLLEQTPERVAAPRAGERS